MPVFFNFLANIGLVLLIFFGVLFIGNLRRK